MTWCRTAALGVLALGVASCAEASDPAGDIRPGAPRLELNRPDTPGSSLQFRFDDGDVVETFASPGGAFLVHFAREGEHAVDADDEDGDGVPDFVEEVAETYDEVLTFYEGLGFLDPLGDEDVDDNGGDGRFDVYLVDFGGVGDGTFRVDACLDDAPDRCAGFMTQENDYAGYGYPSTRYANRVLASHEFFHAVQAAYDRDQGSVIAEGSAVWATEQFDPSLDDFEAFLPGYFENVDRPLDEPLPGPVDPFSYGSAIFFQFLTEAYGDTVVRALWESLVDGASGVDDPQWLGAIDSVLQAEAGVSFAVAFVEFARWNLHTGAFADPETSYENGADYPRVKLEEETAPFSDDGARVFYASTSYVAVRPGNRSDMTAAIVATADEPDATDGVRLILAYEDGDAIVSLEPADPTAGTEAVPAGDGPRMIVVLINTATSGDAKKPGLCIGDVDEVASCKAAIGAGGAGGAGGGATGATTSAATTTASSASTTGSTTGAGDGAGGGAGGDEDEDQDDGGCGCEVPGPAGERSHAWVAAAATALYTLRRRRRRTTTTTAG